METAAEVIINSDSTKSEAVKMENSCLIIDNIANDQDTDTDVNASGSDNLETVLVYENASHECESPVIVMQMQDSLNYDTDTDEDKPNNNTSKEITNKAAQKKAESANENALTTTMSLNSLTTSKEVKYKENKKEKSKEDDSDVKINGIEKDNAQYEINSDSSSNEVIENLDLVKTGSKRALESDNSGKHSDSKYSSKKTSQSQMSLQPVSVMLEKLDVEKLSKRGVSLERLCIFKNTRLDLGRLKGGNKNNSGDDDDNRAVAKSRKREAKTTGKRAKSKAKTKRMRCLVCSLSVDANELEEHTKIHTSSVQIANNHLPKQSKTKSDKKDKKLTEGKQQKRLFAGIPKVVLNLKRKNKKRNSTRKKNHGNASTKSNNSDDDGSQNKVQNALIKEGRPSGRGWKDRLKQRNMEEGTKNEIINECMLTRRTRATKRNIETEECETLTKISKTKEVLSQICFEQDDSDLYPMATVSSSVHTVSEQRKTRVNSQGKITVSVDNENDISADNVNNNTTMSSSHITDSSGCNVSSYVDFSSLGKPKEIRRETVRKYRTHGHFGDEEITETVTEIW